MGKFPLLKVAVIGAVLFANQFATLVIFPFLPFMIHDFYPDTPKSQLGPYAGILGSAFSFGSFMGSIWWGKTSDKHGRRIVMLCGLCGTLLASFLFGLSTNFPQAVLYRFAWGALNGNIGACKTYLSEICEEAHQAKAFSVIGLAAGVGRLIGPVTGAFLAHPAEEFPRIFGSVTLFKNHPYFLPCAVGSAMTLLCLVLAYLYLEESLPSIVQNRQQLRKMGSGTDVFKSVVSHANEDDQGDIGGEIGNYRRKVSKRTSTSQLMDMSITELVDDGKDRQHAQAYEVKKSYPLPIDDHSQQNSEDISADSIESRTLLSHEQSNSSDIAYLDVATTPTPRSVLALARDQYIGKSTAIYGLLALGHIVVQEVVPLYFLTSAAEHGLNFNATDMGQMLLYAAPAQILSQVFLFPYFSTKYGYKRVYQYGLAAYLIGLILTPEIHRFSPPRPGNDLALHRSSSDNNTYLFSSAHYIILPSVLFALANAAAAMSFTATFVLISNSSPAHERGAANGVGQTYASLGRIIGPLLGGWLFAWSERNGMNWPFDFHFVWYVVSVIIITGIWICSRLPDAVNHKLSA
eukprot:m.89190 g.89190  ORF g.89190 m.89190 type:complete len:576 (-) comp8827_c0_seq1:107-1834(-)